MRGRTDSKDDVIKSGGIGGRETGILPWLYRLVAGKSRHSLVEFFRYAVVSGVSLLVDFSLLYSLTEFLGIHYLISAVVGYSCGMIVNYLLSILWVFPTRRYRSVTLEFTLFATIGLLGMGINELLLWLFTEILLVYYMISRAISAVVGYVWKYAARKAILFRRNPRGG